MPNCATCNGTGIIKVTGFINRTSGCSAVIDEPMPCFDCRGTGHVLELTLKLRRIGKHIREGRQELDLTMREQAKILRIPIGQLIDLEHGKI